MVKIGSGETIAQIQWMQGENYTGNDEVILNVYGDLDIENSSRISIYGKGLLEVGNQDILDELGPWNPETNEGYKSDLKLTMAIIKNT